MTEAQEPFKIYLNMFKNELEVVSAAWPKVGRRIESLFPLLIGLAALVLVLLAMATSLPPIGWRSLTGARIPILGFALFYLKEKMAWNYAVAFVLLFAAVAVAFGFKAPVAA